MAAALTLVVAASAFGYVEWRLGQIHHVKVAGLKTTGHSDQSHAAPGVSTPPFTLLVVGSDDRASETGDCVDAGGTSTQVQGQRSDSIVLVRVLPATKKLALLSIPRDTLEPVPGYGTTRINTAFNSGNPSLLIQVLDSDFGIEVNHYAEFTFQTFCDVAQAIGGVEQYFPAPAKDVMSGLNVPQAGCVNLNGPQALAFVRSREYQYYLNGEWHYQYYPESDLGRIQRQQAFIKGAIKKAEQVAPTNPITLNNLIGGITSNLTLDSTFSNSLIFSLAKNFRSADVSNIPQYTLPTVNSTAVPGALDAEPAQDQATINEWLNAGTTAPTSPSSTAKAGNSPPTTTVSPSSVAIEVANGSGTSGQAASAVSSLSSIGYNASIASALVGYNYSQNVVQYAPDSLAAAKQLQSELVGGAQLQEDSALTPTVYNLQLITGQSYKGFTSSASSSSTTTSPSTTLPASPAFVGTSTVEADSSSMYNGHYIPPGRVPGQTIPNCGE